MSNFDWDDGDLYRREPSRECATVVLDQESNKSFVGTEWCAVDAERSLLLAITISIGEAEPCRDCKVYLVGRERELSSDRAPDLDVDLGTVECCLVGYFDEWNICRDQCLAHHVFGLD